MSRFSVLRSTTAGAGGGWFTAALLGMAVTISLPALAFAQAKGGGTGGGAGGKAGGGAPANAKGKAEAKGQNRFPGAVNPANPSPPGNPNVQLPMTRGTARAPGLNQGNQPGTGQSN